MSTETCYATIISHCCALTHVIGGGSVTASGHVGSSTSREHVAGTDGELRSQDFVPYRECGDAPGWYPASTLAASASPSAAARLAQAPAEEKTGKRRCGEKLQGRTFLGGGGDFIWTWCCCGGCGERRTCSGFRLHGGAEKGKTAGSVTLASPPSRHFLTRPHCVLLPLRLPHAGPHQLGTRLLLWPLFHLFI